MDGISKIKQPYSVPADSHKNIVHKYNKESNHKKKDDMKKKRRRQSDEVLLDEYA